MDARATAELPELSVYVPPAYPAAAPKNVAVPVVVYNDGPGDSPATMLQVWANWTGGRPPACGTVGTCLSRSRPSRRAHQRLTAKGLSLPVGRATVWVVVDAACAIAEVYEDNNFYITDVTVLPTVQPALNVGYLYMPPSAAANGSLVIILEVDNLSAVAAEPSTVRVWSDVGDSPPLLTCATAKARPPNAMLNLGAIKAGGKRTALLSGIPAPHSTGKYRLQLSLDAGALVNLWPKCRLKGTRPPARMLAAASPMRGPKASALGAALISARTARMGPRSTHPHLMLPPSPR